MSYQKTDWQNHIVERPDTYNVTQNSDGTVTQKAAFGTVIQEGTPLSAENLNHMEEGIEDAHRIAEGKMVATPYVVELPVNGWNDLEQTVQLAGVTKDSILLITAVPESYNQYCGAGVYCSAQNAGTLTFAATALPEGDLAANVLIFS